MSRECLLLLAVAEGTGPVAFGIGFLVELPCAIVQALLAIGKIDDLGWPFYDSDHSRAARIAAAVAMSFVAVALLAGFVAAL